MPLRVLHGDDAPAPVTGVHWCVSGTSPASLHFRHRYIGCPRCFLHPAGSLVLSGSCPHRRRILCTGCVFSHAFWCCLCCTHLIKTLHVPKYVSLNPENTTPLILNYKIIFPWRININCNKSIFITHSIYCIAIPNITSLIMLITLFFYRLFKCIKDS